MSALCIGCYADPDVQPDCSICRGTGLSQWIPLADRPWDEMAPNLWLGGYDFHPLSSGRDNYTTEMIMAAGFDVVISFYPPYGVDLGRVEHHAMRIPDGFLGSGELIRDHFRKVRSPFCLVNKAFVDYLLASEEASLVQRFANALDWARRRKEADLEMAVLSQTLIGQEAAASVRLDGETQVIENATYGDQT
jgi:hypothetical protein